jgi:hypothetical protein
MKTMDHRKERVMNGTEYDDRTGAAEQAQYQQQIAGSSPPPAPAAGARKGYKSPALATWLSVGPGLGQAYVGYYLQGFINMAVVASLITFLSSNASRGMEPFAGIALAFFWVWNLIDANRRATHVNRALDGLGGEVPPEDFAVPGTGGSMFGGIVLIVVGLLFFLDLQFGISMAWVKDWWPLALVGIGVYLIVAARAKKKDAGE